MTPTLDDLVEPLLTFLKRVDRPLVKQESFSALRETARELKELLEEAALAAAPASGWEGEDKLTVEQAWTILCETPDITSPEEYPDHALITMEQLGSFMARAAPASAEPVGWQYRRHQAFLDTYPQASEYVMHLYSTEYEARVASLSATDLVNGNFPQALIDAAIVRPVFTIGT